MAVHGGHCVGLRGGLLRCACKDRVGGGVKARHRLCEERSDVLIQLLMLSSLSCFYPVDILEGVYT